MCPIDKSIFDFMHTWLVGGIFNVHVGYLIHAIKEFGYGQQVLDQYTNQFVWPGNMGGKSNPCKDMFSSKRYKSHWKEWSLKVQASERLGIMPVLACLMAGAIGQGQPMLDRHASWFLILVQCIELILRSSKFAIDLEVLQQSIGSHLKAFQDLYGAQAMTPKFHYSLHVPTFLRRFGWVPNCFVVERKHKIPKRFENHMCTNHASYERSALREVTNMYISILFHVPEHFLNLQV